MDVLWLIFLLGLAVLPPVREYHKQLTLLAIGVVQFTESRIIGRWPQYGRSAVVLVKILLATLLINHTGELSINSTKTTKAKPRTVLRRLKRPDPPSFTLLDLSCPSGVENIVSAQGVTGAGASVIAPLAVTGSSDSFVAADV